MLALWLNPRNWPTAMLCVALWLSVRLLSRRRLLAFGAWLGGVLGRWSGQRELVASTNLTACFPELDEATRDALVQETLASTGMGLMETGLALWATDRSLEPGVEIVGQEHLDRALADGRGVLILMAHYTMVELTCRLLNRAIDPPAMMLGRRHNQPLLDALMERARQRHAGRTLEKKDLKGLFRELKKNRAVCYAPDQNFSYQSVFAPFFGIAAATVTATAEIAKRTGARIVPLWCVRTDSGYRLQIEPAWDGFPTGDEVADATRVNGWIEHQVRQNPGQYLWVHRRFKTRPDGEPPFYPVAARRAKDRLEH